MTDPLWKELSNYRLKTAGETLVAAQLLFENEKYKDSINRSYYTIFHCMRAILALEGADYKKHSGVISHFRENYIKNGVFPKELSEFIGQASLIRNQSDYEDFFLASKEDAEKQMQNAARFLETVTAYLNSEGK